MFSSSKSHVLIFKTFTVIFFFIPLNSSHAANSPDDKLYDDKTPVLSVILPSHVKLNNNQISLPFGVTAFDIRNGSVLHLFCKGSRALAWNFPSNHMVMYKFTTYV